MVVRATFWALYMGIIVLGAQSRSIVAGTLHGLPEAALDGQRRRQQHRPGGREHAKLASWVSTYFPLSRKKA